MYLHAVQVMDRVYIGNSFYRVKTSKSPISKSLSCYGCLIAACYLISGFLCGITMEIAIFVPVICNKPVKYDVIKQNQSEVG